MQALNADLLLTSTLSASLLVGALIAVASLPWRGEELQSAATAFGHVWLSARDLAGRLLGVAVPAPPRTFPARTIA